jgi:thiosulfate/3-mercaptopyruvate sulfurtransferase
MADVREWVDDYRTWNRVLVDTRGLDEYQGLPGAPTYGASRVGHIPSAVNLTWNELLADDGMLLPRDELERILIGRGVRPDAAIITYCTGGVRSAHTWYVLESLGYPSVRNYSGSWWEWSLDRRNPVRPGSGMRPVAAPPWPPIE